MSAPVAPQMRDMDGAVTVQRVTKGGRQLLYQLRVIQQPERARACGSGPKSSQDRRPVDPPPVVELQIFEGKSIHEGKDITFNYNANFFLFATLEHARPIANGRVQNPATTTPCVLTGMPVAAMAYLDRPKEAGYFLFPDLSVRHEGRYRLAFVLYEETKDDKDMDPDVDKYESFDFRMEVKSNPFNVYSAKKFPGLAESTGLSRTIADQGCRVRIRRDVRMRRRDGKPGGDFDEDEYARNRRTQTPEVHNPYRARSLSNSSVDRTPYQADPQRRQSGADYAPQPPTFQNGTQPPPSGGFLSFGNSNPPFAYPNQPNVQQPSSGVQLPTRPASQQAINAPASSQTLSSNGGYPERQPPLQPYSNNIAPTPAAPRNAPLEIDYRRASTSYQAPPPVSPLLKPVAAQESRATGGPRLPSIDSLLNFDGRSARMDHQISPTYPPPRLQSYSQTNSFPAPGSTEPMPRMQAPLVLNRPGKRQHGETFNSSSEPLYNGSRPVDPHHNPNATPSDLLTPHDQEHPMVYKRADGKVCLKPLTSVV